LREALRRLTEWRLVEPRRGSGIVVRPLSEWSIEVLPAYLRYGKPGAGQPTLSRLLLDLLALRRSTLVEIIRIISDRIPPGSTVAARAALSRAWAARHQAVQFQIEDFGVMRALVESARFYPALWLLNRLASVYLEIAHSISGVIDLPPDYVDAHERMLSALEARQGDQAVAIMKDYFDRHDSKLVAMLEVTA
jgi:DNA-binding FadR family transcriptional regulator